MIGADKLANISSYQTLSADKNLKSYEAITKLVNKSGAYIILYVTSTLELRGGVWYCLFWELWYPPMCHIISGKSSLVTLTAQLLSAFRRERKTPSRKTFC